MIAFSYFISSESSSIFWAFVYHGLHRPSSPLMRGESSDMSWLGEGAAFLLAPLKNEQKNRKHFGKIIDIYKAWPQDGKTCSWANKGIAFHIYKL